ncbi:hypothetical protein B0H14DRAFT_2992643 [Mycena olivaceomarginata]|nr:hypothetical protein B0H14DRAFT_2992643 [Mycena olivaceomarginata]
MAPPNWLAISLSGFLPLIRFLSPLCCVGARYPLGLLAASRRLSRLFLAVSQGLATPIEGLGFVFRCQILTRKTPSKPGFRTPATPSCRMMYHY